MLWSRKMSGCEDDCSGRGDCLNGTCVCEIRFAGDHCDGLNIPYHTGIGGVFFLVALVCIIQLVMCIISEYQRLKNPTFLRACKITTQKLLYIVAFLASLIRGAYFTQIDTQSQREWSSSLLSAYYPLLMSGSSLIVCFWAEVFHLRDIRWEKPQFLSKSFLAFLTFNLITYSLLLVEFLTTNIANTPNFYAHVFNGCYAVLLFIVVIFFLIYGVEVYFKVRGGFVADTSEINGYEQKINLSQLHQSRFGLISMAFMLIIIVGFLFSETLSEFWKKKVPVNSRNWHDVVFRVVEIGVAVWFPCVLWNCIQPAELWLLNPRKLLNKLDLENVPGKNTEKDINVVSILTSKIAPIDEEGELFLNKKDCWICLENDQPLIQPCQCRGDVSSVHHECLLRWLIESASTNPDNLRCKVCGTRYEVEHSRRLDWERGFTPQHWLATFAIVSLMCISVAGAWIVVQFFEGSYVRILSISIAMLIVYLCIRFLGLNTVNAYQRAKVSALNIVTPTGEPVSTISESIVAVNIPRTEPTAI
ncbi:uncharacterized protein LOC123290945 isoform X2 [Chrysoperla carnea]|uniref:uncharacterized protein LOC123290945 isoform X2 n=1 Tax=Chrysoperla carnea TaxID=189513 RepID=UPI001D0878C9|nr:uncharacterized protein LOC123290945 isoform X2 [Chrysoperla carnea]